MQSAPVIKLLVLLIAHLNTRLPRCCFAQVAVIEFARNVLGVKDADSTEFNPGTPNPAVVFMPEISTKHMGGTMRLGGRRTVLQVRWIVTNSS
jgi:CTP synthase